jgi:hypothetical protein
VGQKGHGKRRGLYFFLWKRKRQSSIRRRIFCTAGKRVGFVNDRMSYVWILEVAAIISFFECAFTK